MWIALSVPILLIFCGGALVLYGLMTAISVGLTIAVFAIIIFFFFVLLIGFIWLITIPYKGCESKEAKIFYCFCITLCLVIILGVIVSKIKISNITVVNESKNEIITEINILPIGDKTSTKENRVFDSKSFGFNNRFSDEMKERCKKLGLNYKKIEEWFSLSDKEKSLVSGLRKSESNTFRVSKGTWIITLKTINSSTENYYSVIYDKNAFCTHLGETLSFSYSGENISLLERQKAQFMPEFIYRHLKKEIPKKFEPNLILITKEAKNVLSGLVIKDHANFMTFPTIVKDKYTFKCLLPDTTFTTEKYFSEWNGSHFEDTFNEIKELTINNDCLVFYIDEEKKTIKQINSSINYRKFKNEN